MTDIPPSHYLDPMWPLLASHRPISPFVVTTTVIGAILPLGVKADLSDFIPHGEVGSMLDPTMLVIFVVPEDIPDDDGH